MTFVVCACLAFWTSRAAKQRDIVSRIEAINGVVEYRPTKLTPLLGQYLARDYVYNASKVELQYYRWTRLKGNEWPSVTEMELLLKLLKQLPGLEEVNLLTAEQHEWHLRYSRELPAVEIKNGW